MDVDVVVDVDVQASHSTGQSRRTRSPRTPAMAQSGSIGRIHLTLSCLPLHVSVIVDVEEDVVDAVDVVDAALVEVAVDEVEAVLVVDRDNVKVLRVDDDEVLLLVSVLPVEEVAVDSVVLLVAEVAEVADDVDELLLLVELVQRRQRTGHVARAKFARAVDVAVAYSHCSGGVARQMAGSRWPLQCAGVVLVVVDVLVDDVVQ